jgi:nicotinate-nucleotide--dimethylbenzimidazole phosphoribosyltransferase
MSLPGARAVLVLGGAGSGRSQYAETLVAGATDVRRLPGGGKSPADLCRTLAEAAPGESLLVDGLDRWLSPDGASDPPPASLAAAVRDCPARQLVLVSPEYGMGPPVGPGDAVEALGALNAAVAAAVDEVVLVVAGQPIQVRTAGNTLPAVTVTRSPDVPESDVPEPETRVPDVSDLTVPTPDDTTREACASRLAGAGLGALTAVATFAAATQGTPQPVPWRAIRMLVLHGDHRGAAAAGAGDPSRPVEQLRGGTGPLAQLAADARVQVHEVACAPAQPIEDGPALADDVTRQALATGRRLAEQAADEGVDLLVLGAIGDGAETAAVAVTAVLGGAATEPASLLGRVRTPDGTIDDAAWITRCTALRDAVFRARSTSRTEPLAALAEVGGADIATAAGVILGAAARRTPVALDGPVAAAGALVARRLAAPSRRWCLLTDHGGQPAVVHAAAVLGLTPLLDLKLDLGEGSTTLAALPLLRAALRLAGA